MKTPLFLKNLGLMSKESIVVGRFLFFAKFPPCKIAVVVDFIGFVACYPPKVVDIVSRKDKTLFFCLQIINILAFFVLI